MHKYKRQAVQAVQKSRNVKFTTIAYLLLCSATKMRELFHSLNGINMSPKYLVLAACLLTGHAVASDVSDKNILM